VKKTSDEQRKTESPGQRTLPVVEEVLSVGKRTVPAGATRVTKRVRERIEEIDEPLRKEQVTVERVTVNRFVDEALAVREENGTTIIPVLEEVLVVEKRLLLKEELHIRTSTETVHHSQRVALRSEEVEVEHLDAPGQAEEPKH
jgi:uncharacterized protein (TIGR02271 family)